MNVRSLLLLGWVVAFTVSSSAASASPETALRAIDAAVDREALLAELLDAVKTGEVDLSARVTAPTGVVVTIGRPQETARVFQEVGERAAELPTILSALRDVYDDERAPGRTVLRVDVVVEADAPKKLEEHLLVGIDRTLDGIWLAAAQLLLLPDELVSRRLVNSDGSLQLSRLNAYLREGGREGAVSVTKQSLVGSDYQRVRFASAVEGLSGPQSLLRGSPATLSLTPWTLRRAVEAGGECLLRHRQRDGAFGYRYRPKQDSYGDGQNLLRQAGTSYAAIEIYAFTRDERYLDAARRTIHWLLAKTRPPRDGDHGASFQALVSPGEEAKLGGAALLILAMVEDQRVTGTRRWIEEAQALARFLVHQQGEDGRFASKYFYGPEDDEFFESIYYPGEAVLALARLFSIDGDPLWLETSMAGADWLILERDAGKSASALPHDHWLLMGLAELTKLADSERTEIYLEHARRIAGAILDAQRREGSSSTDWVGSYYTPPRSTPTATRSEALVAMVEIARAHDFDATLYLDGLRRGLAFQLRTQLNRINGAYLPRPDLAVGCFRRSFNLWDARIDYTQHNVSSMIGYSEIVAPESP